MPPWVQEGGYKAWAARLKDPQIRERVRREMENFSASQADFRGGQVASATSQTGADGRLVRKVLVYGEAYVSLWAYYLIDPAYPRYGR